MNIFDIKQRKTMSFEDWMRNRTVAEKGKQEEKGAAEITKDGGALDPEKGKAGYDNAMDADTADLDKKKHDAVKATYGGASTAAADYDNAMDDPKKINIKK
jgi:hypothetical protein